MRFAAPMDAAVRSDGQHAGFLSLFAIKATDALITFSNFRIVSPIVGPRRRLVPGAIEFVDHLPRTSTGKLQKFELSEKEWAGHSSRIQGCA